MAETLTPQQRMAVEDRGGNLLVSAAAGSGKTKVLVDRLLSYLTDPVKPADIDSFLIITYTKAAASELRGKIASKLSQVIAQNPENRHLQQQMQRLYLTKISTVHAFCGDILKEYAYMLDLSGDFRVADENECIELQATALERVLNDAYESGDVDNDFYAFVDSQGLGRDDRQVPQLILSVYRRAKCHLDYELWLERCVDACRMDTVTDVGQTLWGQFLMDDLKAYLQLQIQALSKCANAAADSAGMEKPAALLSDTVYQLERLCSSQTWDEIFAAKEISYGTLSFSKKCEDTELIEQIKAVRENCKKGLKKRLRRFSDCSASLIGDIRSTEPSVRGLVKLVRRFDSEYTRLKHSRHILDFSDLEHKTLDLLLGKKRSGITSVAREIGQRYVQIMVDEYQDSNSVQDAIFRALSDQRNNCFMVGDVKQSIYQFRLADPGIFLDKYSRYEPAETALPGQGRKVLLSSNFRSCGAVIEAVNDVFYDCMYEDVGGLRYTEAEALKEGIPHSSMPDPEIELYGINIQSDTYAEEAAFVAQRTKQLLDGAHMVRDADGFRPIVADDIVILLRSPGSVGAVFQDALETIGIGCNFNSGTELMEAEEIQFMHALLQVISNPLQDIPLIAVLSSRVFGFTADELAGIRTKDLHADFYTALQQDGTDKTKQFLQVLNRLRLDARMMDLPGLIDRIFLLTDADAIYHAMSDGAFRMSNLRTFCQMAASFGSAAQASLESFLDHLAVIEAEGHQIPSGADTAGAVTIMSIHKSKGLEFPVVFLCGLSKSFNMEHTHEQVLCDSELGLGLSCVDTYQRLRYPTVAKHAIAAKMQAESISEELRVLYVAMTRPKDRLIMTYASASMDKELFELRARMDICDPLLMSSEVGSAGDWVLLAALRHSEATTFHALSGKPARVRILQHPWKIKVVDCVVGNEEASCEMAEQVTVDETQLEKMRRGLAYSYPNRPSTQTPSKLTATQLKGRFKDFEAAEGAQLPTHRQFRKPSFVQDRLSGAQYGTAMHTVMQHLRFEVCTDLHSLDAELERLVQEGLITNEIADAVDRPAILDFFETDIGRALRGGVTCLREFKFSILDDAQRYMPDTQGDFVLLQGVVDCAIIAEEGITILDFKTDRVTQDTVAVSVKGYKDQVNAYAYALEKIYRKPVLDTYLYYFRLGKLVRVGKDE